MVILYIYNTEKKPQKYILKISRYLVISTITLRGSLAMVNTNKPNGGPKAINVHPKNSIKVMVTNVF
jgi:hypothetical protein